MEHRTPLFPYQHCPSDAIPLPLRTAADTSEPDYLTAAKVAEKCKGGVVLHGQTRTGRKVVVKVLFQTANTVRILLEDERSDPNRVRLARHEPSPDLCVEFREQGDALELATESIRTGIRLNRFQIHVEDVRGRRLLEQNYSDRNIKELLMALPFGFTDLDGRRVAFHDSFSLDPREHFYGFGEKFTELEKRGQRLEMWLHNPHGVHDERAYKNVPFFLSTRGYGIFVDSLTAVNFDIGHSNNAIFSIVVPDTALDYYVIVGQEPKEIIAGYSTLVGLPVLPPKWAFGLWVSSGMLRESQEDTLRRARALRQRNIPADVIHLDSYWQEFPKWSDLNWDEEMYPRPEEMLRQLHEMGFKVCLWINPYLSVRSERFQEAKEKGYLLKNPSGEAYEAEVWGGFHPECGFIDFTNPAAAAWFKGLLGRLLGQGVDLFKADFGEAVPADAVAWNGMRGAYLHNYYPLLYNDAVIEITRETKGGKGLVWGRSTYAGGQRHPIQWGGDPNSTYQGMAATLRGGLSLGMSGHPFWSHDIGGFHTCPTADLYIRWAQFGLLSPFSRAHGMSSRLPWDFGGEAEEIFRRYANLRYELLPYLYSAANRSVESGIPMMRPMVLEFPEDVACHHCDLQYMLGSEILVAPVFNPEGECEIYFPAGRWFDYHTRAIVAGPTTQRRTAPLELLPLYVRENALIPTTEPRQSLSDATFDPVFVNAYVSSEGSTRIYDDDGITELKVGRKETQVLVEVTGAKKHLGLRLFQLPESPPVEGIEVNGRTLQASDLAALGGSHPGLKRNQAGDLIVWF